MIREVLKSADLVLIPTRPSPHDLRPRPLISGGNHVAEIGWATFALACPPRESPASPPRTQVVENRFTVACNEVKKRNITVWAISFGTSMTSLLSNCAGPGHSFQADDATQLNDAFAKIAASMGDLRISK